MLFTLIKCAVHLLLIVVFSSNPEVKERKSIAGAFSKDATYLGTASATPIT